MCLRSDTYPKTQTQREPNTQKRLTVLPCIRHLSCYCQEKNNMSAKKISEEQPAVSLSTPPHTGKKRDACSLAYGEMPAYVVHAKRKIWTKQQACEDNEGGYKRQKEDNATARSSSPFFTKNFPQGVDKKMRDLIYRVHRRGWKEISPQAAWFFRHAVE